MKVRLIISTPFFKEFYKIEEGTVLKVLNIVHRRRRNKKQGKWLEKLYVVQVREHYMSNHHLQLKEIYLTEKECVQTTFKLSEI